MGRAIPKDIEKVKKQFIYELDKEKWFDLFDNVKENYIAELAKIPKTAKEKGLREFFGPVHVRHAENRGVNPQSKGNSSVARGRRQSKRKINRRHQGS